MHHMKITYIIPLFIVVLLVVAGVFPSSGMMAFAMLMAGLLVVIQTIAVLMAGGEYDDQVDQLP